MSQVNISYKTAKALKEFLGESAPEPMEGLYYCSGCGKIHTEYSYCEKEDDEDFPAYRLEDLLSKPFCEAMARNMKCDMSYHMKEFNTALTYSKMTTAYYHGGLPAVEKALCEMMEGK